MGVTQTWEEGVMARGQMSPHHEYFYLETNKSEEHFFHGFKHNEVFEKHSDVVSSFEMFQQLLILNPAQKQKVTTQG